MKCYTCDKEIKDGEEVYEDGYFVQVNCSWECTVKYMMEFFSFENDKPNVKVVNGEIEYEDE